jgi:hypothetical protein
VSHIVFQDAEDTVVIGIFRSLHIASERFQTQTNLVEEGEMKVRQIEKQNKKPHTSAE